MARKHSAAELTVRQVQDRNWETATLEEHVALIKVQVDRSLQDPELIRLAQAIAADKPDTSDRRRRPIVRAWGNTYELPGCPGPSNGTELAEDLIIVTRIWNFVVANWSYIQDPPNFDLFATAKYNLDARAYANLLEESARREPNVEARRDLVAHAATLRDVKTMGAGDCDDACVLLASLLKAVGFRNVRARIVSTDAEYWEHVYTMVGVPKTQSSQLLALDPTVNGAVPGWEYGRARAVQDFIL